MQNVPPNWANENVLNDSLQNTSAKSIAIIDAGLAYLELCKPRVVALMLLTAVVGMQLAVPGFVPWNILVFATIGIALAASSAAVINHLADRHIDSLMGRTKKRPIPTGRISPQAAFTFAVLIGIIGIAILYVLVNPLTALLTFLTQVGYAGIYTLYLKHATPQNIVIGGIAGATPPLLGWCAVTNSINPHGLLLVLIIFLWTPPHFWSLAISRRTDYENANVPMLPVTHGIAYTKKHILLYTLLLIAGSLLPFATGMSGLIYLVATFLMNVGFLYLVIQLMLTDNPAAGMRVFRFSIVYLMLLFAVLLVDHFWLI